MAEPLGQLILDTEELLPQEEPLVVEAHTLSEIEF
jgi:hypothetical protein